MRRAPLHTILLLPFLLLGGHSRLCAAASAVPPGFEMLMAEQTTAVDIYYGNQYLTSSLATFTPTELRFHEPAEIVSRIPDLLQPNELLAALRGALATHNELLCLRPGQTNCGQLTPEVADLIFDETRFRADLFINPRLLAVRQVAIDRYLPPSDAGLAFLQTFASAISGSRDQGDTTYSVNGWTTISRGESRLRMISNYSGGDQFAGTRFKVDALALERESRGKQWKLGLFRSQSTNVTFLTQRDLLGGRIASSLDTLADLDQSEGNELTVFLPARSRVDLYKEGRLYSSRIYEIGNQTLDTTDLPGGAYDVTLVIRDSFGITREETRFYVKSSRLPPRGERLYFLDLGEVRERANDQRFPASTGVYLLRGGVSERIGDHMAVDLATQIASGERLLEAGGTYLMRGGELHADFAANDRAQHAYLVTARRRFGDAAVAANYRRSLGSDDAGGLIGATLEQATLSFNWPVGPGRLQLDANINDRVGDSHRTYSATYDFHGWRTGKQQIDLALQLARNNRDLQFIANLTWRLQEERWNMALRPRYQYTRPDAGASDRDLQTSGVVTWNRRQPESDLRMTLRTVAGTATDSLEYEVDHVSNVGHGQLNLDYADRTGGDSNLRYGGTYAASVIADHSGIAIGGRDQSQAAVIIDVRGASDEGYFEVFVNGSRRTTARVGERTVLSLRPFETYQIYLQDRGSAYLEYDDQVRTVTLYPGNVVTMTWGVSEVLVVFGRLTRPDGSPVANALLENLPGLATTDSDGNFQAQMSADLPAILARTRTYRCEAPVGEFRTRQNIGMLGTLECKQGSE